MTNVHTTVRSVVTERELITLAPDQTVREAATILSARRIGAAPVVDGERLVGIFTERDVLQRVVAARRHPEVTAVAEVMTPDPRTIDAETSLVNAFAIMIEGGFRHLPVVQLNGKVVAMVSMRDVPLEYRIMHRQWTDWIQNKGVATAEA